MDEAETAIAKATEQISKLFGYRETPVTQALADFVAAYPDLQQETADLQTVFDYAFALGVEEQDVRFDPCLARGMDYYTGPVFEARSSAWPYGSLAGGGRYDEMIEIDGKIQPAVGASFGLERIEQALNDLNLVPPELKSNLAEVMVATQEDWLPGPLSVAKSLRDLGFRTFVYPRPTDKLGVQTRFAARNGIRAVVFYGPDEKEAGEITLRYVSEEKAIKDRKSAGGSKTERVPLEPILGLATAIRNLLATAESSSQGTAEA
jgi:histidyl-tRNA synthetase